MARIHPIKHHPVKCACASDSPNSGPRIIKRTYSKNGTIIASRDDGTQFAHNDVTYIGQDVKNA